MKIFLFIKYTVVLIAGIVLGEQISFKSGSYVLPLAFIASFILYLLLFIIYSWDRKRSNLKIFLALVGYVLLFMGGGLLVVLQGHPVEKSIELHDKRIKAYIGIITSEVSYKTNIQTELEVKKIQLNNEWVSVKEKIVIFVKSEQLLRFSYGDVVLIYGAPASPSPIRNTWDFDYKSYLKNQGIFYIHFITPASIKVLGHKDLNILKQIAIKTRNWGDTILKTYITSPREYEIAAALILGIRNSMDPSLKDTYQKAGVIHVLAVSGLHVLLLFNLLQFIFAPLKTIKGGKIIIAFLTILILWLFALISGFSPSVIRAVVMFTLFVMGKTIYNKKTEIFNIIAVSSFFMLILNPRLIYDLGFQLSFSAVIGLALIATPIYESIEIKSKLLQEIWKIISSTIAAQMTTLPLILYYFNYFSTWFILTNLFMIPGTTILLYIGICILTLSWIFPVAQFLGNISIYILKFIHYLLHLCERLPFYQVTGFNISLWDVLLLYSSLLFLLLFYINKKFVSFSLAIILMILFSVKLWIINFGQIQKKGLVVYNIDRTVVLGLIAGKSILLIKDSSVSNSVLLRKTTNHLTQEGINNIIIKESQCLKEMPIPYFQESGTILCTWNGKSIGIFSELKEACKRKTEVTIITKTIYRNNFTIPATSKKMIGYFKSDQLLEKRKDFKVIHNLNTMGAFYIQL